MMRKHIQNNREFFNDNAFIEKLDSMRKHIVNNKDVFKMFIEE